MPKASQPCEVAVYFRYRELFDRIPDLSELVSIIEKLDRVGTVRLLCQMNADFRLTRRNREATSGLQRELAGSLLDDHTIERLEQRFGAEHAADRPIFHPVQILNVLRLVIQHSRGSSNPLIDDSAKHQVGTACLMMSDFLTTEEERVVLTTDNPESVLRALMIQSLGPFEIQNSSSISHVVYRAHILFSDLLKITAIRDRIKRECEGFDFEQEFSRIVGVPLKHWLYLLIAFYTYLMHYLGKDNDRHPEHLSFEGKRFTDKSRIEHREVDVVLRLISSTPHDLKQALQSQRPTEWRYDFVPFKSRPLIELSPDIYFCTDLSFLVEKMHSGVYWAINDGLSTADRPKLFKAWGILFEEYVNSFLSNRTFREPLKFWSRPEWQDGTESFDGAFMQDSRFIPIECKGGFLKIEARYSGKLDSFEADLDLKIGEGCRQLARKIQAIFDNASPNRKRLRAIPTDHVTKVVPVVVVQDPILRGPLVNWTLNRTFNHALDRTKLRSGVSVEPLNVVSTHEMETMAESADAGAFDIFHGLQLRCSADPEMKLGLHNFLLNVPGYSEGVSARREQSMAEQFAELRKYLFEDESTA